MSNSGWERCFSSNFLEAERLKSVSLKGVVCTHLPQYLRYHQASDLEKVAPCLIKEEIGLDAM